MSQSCGMAAAPVLKYVGLLAARNTTKSRDFTQKHQLFHPNCSMCTYIQFFKIFLDNVRTRVLVVVEL